MLATLLLATMIVGFGAWHYVRRRRMLQLGLFFNVCALAYFVFGLGISRVTMSGLYDFELSQIEWMCVAAVLGFNVAYLMANWGRGAPVSGSDYLPTHSSILVVASVGFAFEMAAILLIGPLDFLFSDRIERFAEIRPRTALFYLANLMNVCLPILLARYLRYGERRDGVLLLAICAHGLLLGLVTISRYDLMIVLLVVGYFLERHGKVRPLTVASILVVAFASTLIYKPVLYDVLLQIEYPADVDIGEYTNWIRHTLLLLTRPDVEMPHNGYALTLRSLFVMRPEQDSLAEWYFQEFFPERMILFPGVSYGFSGVWEGYSAMGLPGVAIHFAVFGAFFGWLERSPSAMRRVFAVFAMILTYRLFRSEAYNFVKTYAWYFAYPTIGIMITDRFLTWASGVRPRTPRGLQRHPARRNAVPASESSS